MISSIILFLKIFIILLLVVNILLNCNLFFKIYQLSGYKPFKAIKEYCSKKIFFEIILLLIFNLLYFTTNGFLILTAIYLFGYIFLTYFLNKKKIKNSKNKLVFTKRFIRFYVLYIILNVAFFVVFTFLIIKNINIYFIFINFKIISLFIFILTHFIMLPIEELIKKIYIIKAKNKLKKMPNLIVIGITGSFGKTSVKEYLYQMLKTKFRVCKSQNSYNTPMGFTKVILNDLKYDDEILILEYGADHNHDILKLCKIVKPNHSIITGVTNQHLKTFKTIQNIISTKYELVENTKKGGCIVFNADNKISYNYYKKTRRNKILVGTIKNCDILAKNIKIKNLRTYFTILLKNEEREISTKLLGKHSVNNILLSMALALKMGVELEKIINVIENLTPPPHRLNLIENDGKFILDDSFNANIEGVYYALDVLKTFKNKKIVITCGIVELGKESYKENFKLGKYLQEFDVVIITNLTNKLALSEGIKGGRNKVYYADNLTKATELLKGEFFKGDCVLFLNDLPDNYK